MAGGEATFAAGSLLDSATTSAPASTETITRRTNGILS
jgi:hypothetical protein